jgi:predicted ATPase/DNA-binding SARP family transcriptional activator/Tfp pilus assembly protein PilF
MSPGEPSRVVFCVLGPLRVEVPQREIRIGGIRRRSVLLRLLASPGTSTPVDALADDVWDGDPPAAAASTLQSHVSALRQAVGSDRLLFDDGGYRLRVEPSELDSLMFEQDVATGGSAMAAGDFDSAATALDRALARWRGPAFADVLGTSWAVLAAGQLEEARNTAIEEALEARLALGRHHEVCRMAEEAVAAEPLRERRWAALMLALYRAGRQAEALHTYQRLRETLVDQLGLDPSPQLSRLEHDILAQSPNLSWVGATPVGAREMPAVSSQAPASRSNLPAPVASFVGRKSELVELGKLVGRDRLVTIVGTGGVGKTRLAIEVAASRLHEHRDGVWFVDLAELSDPAGVPGAVADAIGVRQTSGQPVDQLLADRVADMHALLVVDNCEHLVNPVAATVERVLETGPGVRVLATSRQPIGVPGERVWQTPPISFPADPHRQDPAELASFDAVRLFTDRAEPLGTAGDVPARDLRVIAEITARLDGLPLAIELAAARAGQLDLDELASVLQDRLGLSWLGSRTAHGRQQTLAATIGWSYDLLTPQLQSALKRLSVFSGGFTLEAAGAVTGAPGSVTITVAALAERSLIVADRSARPDRPGGAASRYRMLETIRQYCAGRIADDDGPEGERAAREAHSRFFADLAQRASGALTGWHQGQWLTTLESDHANLAAAVNHLLTRLSSADAALQMIVQLDRFWHNRGHLAECAALLRRGLDATGQDVNTTIRCAALTMAGQATVGYDVQPGRAYFTESLDLARRAHDDFDAARALWGLALVGYYTGDQEGANAAGEAAVDLARIVGDPVLLGECLVAYGLVSDPLERKNIYYEALAVTRRSGDRINTGWSHNNLGDSLLADDDLEAARQHFEKARVILREVGAPSLLPVVNLGWVHLRQGDLKAADDAFTEALHGLELLHFRRDTSVVLLGLACTAAAQRDWERAARLLGFADAELQNCGASWADPERTYREQSFTEVERQLGAGFDTHYDSGRAGDRGDLIDYALSQEQVP